MAASKETYHHWIMVAVLVAALAFILWYLTSKGKSAPSALAGMPSLGPATTSKYMSPAQVKQTYTNVEQLAQIKGNQAGETIASKIQAATLSSSKNLGAWTPANVLPI